MAVGQAALRGTLDVPELDAVETRLEVRAVARCYEHAQLLRDVLALHRLHLQAGMELATVPQTALVLQLTESVAHDRVTEARLLLSLPGGLEALECGLLTVEQSAVLTRALAGMDLPVRLAVWARVQAKLLARVQDGGVMPPSVLRSLVATWVIQADPAGAQDRRRQAEDGGDVGYRRRDDGLGDLFATAVPAPLLQAVLARVREAARPWGGADQRTAGKRRLDALLDLVLGRQTMPSDGASDGLDACGTDCSACEACGAVAVGGAGRAGRPCGSRCGCRLDAPAPCGADVVVHVPLGAALGTTDELAELVGHGPLDPEQLAQLLAAGPRLRAVHVDAHGIPVSVADRVVIPPRDDPAALRQALLDLAASPPGLPQPQHPHDHRPAPPPGLSTQPTARPSSSGPPPMTPPRPAPPRLDGESGVAHPSGTPGPYRPPRWLRRLVQFRAPRCEWPGCGMRAQFCDFEHDQAWPAGPTCACNTGPLCRHHHRVKQLGLFTKTRGPSSVVSWTDPTGRSWTRGAQHEPPAAAVRRLPDLVPDEPHSLSDEALAELLTDPDADPVQAELRTLDHDPDVPEQDLLADRLDGDTRWTLDLDDPYLWAA